MSTSLAQVHSRAKTTRTGGRAPNRGPAGAPASPDHRHRHQQNERPQRALRRRRRARRLRAAARLGQGPDAALARVRGPVRQAGPRCIEDVLEYALDALEFADRHFTKHGGVDPHGLTKDEVVAINFYTKENVGNMAQSFFRVLNKAFNAERSQAVPFFAYLKLFVEGARKLPNGCPAKLWRAFPNLDPEWASCTPRTRSCSGGRSPRRPRARTC